jgi:hypothetical protein
MKQRDIFHLFDHVFKCLLGISDPALISLVNGLFDTHYPPSASVSRPSTESVSQDLRRSLADVIITVNGISYLVEVQLRNDATMGLRIFLYIMNEGRRQGAGNRDHVIRIKLPRTRVIYWEPTAGTPDQERIIFELPDGREFHYEARSVKFPRYTVKELEEKGLTALLPFYVIRFRREMRGAREPGKRKKVAAQVLRAAEEVREALERSRGRGELSYSDLGNLKMMTDVLREETYKPYTERGEEGTMWEHIKLVDFDALARREAEITRQRDELAHRADEAIRKLLAMGVSRQELVQEGLLDEAAD